MLRGLRHGVAACIRREMGSRRHRQTVARRRRMAAGSARDNLPAQPGQPHRVFLSVSAGQRADTHARHRILLLARSTTPKTYLPRARPQTLNSRALGFEGSTHGHFGDGEPLLLAGWRAEPLSLLASIYVVPDHVTTRLPSTTLCGWPHFSHFFTGRPASALLRLAMLRYGEE